MREFLILAIHLLVTLVKLLRPGGVSAVAAESLLLKHQLLISNRFRQRAPNLTSLDRFLLGLTTLFLSPRRFAKLCAILKPATLFKFHKALVDRKYHFLFSSSPHRRKPGPKGPSTELIAAIVEMKCRNPNCGCVRIAQQLSHAVGIEIDKDVVRRVLAKHYRPGSGTKGPSWLTFIGHVKDSLWSVDLFRGESTPDPDARRAYKDLVSARWSAEGQWQSWKHLVVAALGDATSLDFVLGRLAGR